MSALPTQSVGNYNVANFASFLEKSNTLIFPAEQDIQKNIPLYMKFFCFEYNKSAIGRASAYSRGGGGGGIIPGASFLKTQIFVPAPPLFTSTTQHSYKAEPTEISTTGFDDLIKSTVAEGLNKVGINLDELNDAFMQDVLARAIKLKNAIGKNTFGYSQDIPLDKTDIIYKPGGQIRSYEVQMYLPCLSIEDSIVAGTIIRTFEALSLPTMLSVGLTNMSIMFHPPLWVFGIGPPDTLQIDPDWSGQPQLSVLRTVKSKRVALETNTLAALGDGSAYKPIAYTLTLLFQELEPAVRITNAGSSTSNTIGSRSIGVITTGDKTPQEIITRPN